MVRANSAWSKNNRRELKHTMARFLAIFAIIGLGVGFFVGLKVCRPAMVQIGSKFVDESQFYDYQLLSTLGLTEEDRDYFAQMDGVLAVEGSMTADLLTSVNNRQLVYKTHQLLDNMNQVQLTAGRMPEAPDECLADDLKLHHCGSVQFAAVSQCTAWNHRSCQRYGRGFSVYSCRWL